MSASTKKCEGCLEHKPLTAFKKHHLTKDGRQNRCNLCSTNLTGKAARRSLYSRRYELKSRYGIDENVYQAMVLAQDGKCAICGLQTAEINDNRSWEKNKLHVDHCHMTRVVRGLLCGRCNHGLGLFDNIEILKRAIGYLMSPPGIPEYIKPVQYPKIENFCERCEHRWIRRVDSPRRCPKCQSLLWKKPRFKKIAAAVMESKKA